MNAEDSRPLSENRFSQLIRLAREGDNDALGELLSAYRNYLLLIANEGLDNEIQAKLGASDIVQQSMLYAQTKIGQFRGESETEFKAWIRKIVNNEVIDNFRKFHTTRRRRANRETSLDDSQQFTAEPTDELRTPSTEALVREQTELVRSAMKQLPEKYRHVIELRNLEALPFDVIGQQMECSADAARKLWFRAIVKLQEAFHGLYPEIQSSILQSLTGKSKPDE